MLRKRKVKSPEYLELKRNIEERDEIRFVVCLNDFFTSIQNNKEIKSEKKLKVYDLVSQLGNCEKEARMRYLKKLEKII